jgi:hypothetical protein
VVGFPLFGGKQSCLLCPESRLRAEGWALAGSRELPAEPWLLFSLVDDIGRRFPYATGSVSVLSKFEKTATTNAYKCLEIDDKKCLRLLDTRIDTNTAIKRGKVYHQNSI